MLEGRERKKKTSRQQMQTQNKIGPDKHRSGPPQNSQGGRKAEAQNSQPLDHPLSRPGTR